MVYLQSSLAGFSPLWEITWIILYLVLCFPLVTLFTSTQTNFFLFLLFLDSTRAAGKKGKPGEEASKSWLLYRCIDRVCGPMGMRGKSPYPPMARCGRIRAIRSYAYGPFFISQNYILIRHRQTKRQTDGQTDRQINRQIDRQIHRHIHMQSDRQTYTRTDNSPPNSLRERWGMRG